MSIQDELARERAAAILDGPRLFSGRVAVGASDMGDRIMVIVPAIDETQRIGPCRWQARDETSHPARGDACLVAFDEQSDPWVIAWWPFST